MASISTEMLSILQCPATKSELKIFDNEIKTADGAKAYYFIENIPWLFKDPEYYKRYWSNKAAEFLNFHKNNIQKIQSELKNLSLDQKTRQRLELLKKAHQLNYQTLSQLLSSFDAAEAGPIEVAVPSHQSLHLYRKNLFRDWGWETDENQISFDLIKNLLNSKWQPQRFCILGSGASRLAMDLHREYKLPMSVAVDFNPLLLLVAQKMNQGHTVSFYDFPAAPIKTEQAAQIYQLASKAETLTDFHFLFADVTDLPFKPGSFQSVLTPWLIDILPMDFSLFAQRVNQILEVGGEWINFGPLGFSHRQESRNLTSEEIIEKLETCGFGVEVEKVSGIKYLSSKNEVNSRNETVYLFRARKISDVNVAPFEFWSPWITHSDQPIPLNDEIRQHQQLIRFQADLFHSINGQLSVNQIAQLFSSHYKLPLEAALKMTLNVLRQFDESLKRK